MSRDIQDLLESYADHAPAGLSPAAWQAAQSRGRRRARLRVAAYTGSAALAAAVVVTVAVTAGPFGSPSTRGVSPAHGDPSAARDNRQPCIVLPAAEVATAFGEPTLQATDDGVDSCVYTVGLIGDVASVARLHHPGPRDVLVKSLQLGGYTLEQVGGATFAHRPEGRELDDILICPNGASYSVHVSYPHSGVERDRREQALKTLAAKAFRS